jgi:hypothetical protein
MAKPQIGDRMSMHATYLLLVVFVVYAYRDLWPLAIDGGRPADIEEGWLLWAKIASTCLGGLVIPLLEPGNLMFSRTTSKSIEEPTPEQTASWFSLLTYSFLDHFILLSSRLSRTGPENFPPLPDSERTSLLVERALPYLDRFSGAPKRHVGLSLIRFFSGEFAVLALLIIIKVTSSFAAPLAINRILLYLEFSGDANEREGTVRPWVWVALLFLGPVVGTISFQAYALVNTRSMVRAEAILTQLVFNHALRLRVKAETGTETSRDESLPKGEKKGKNFTGMLNNLVTTDMANIMDGREFLLLGRCFGIFFVRNYCLECVLSCMDASRTRPRHCVLVSLPWVVVSPPEPFSDMTLNRAQSICWGRRDNCLHTGTRLPGETSTECTERKCTED